DAVASLVQKSHSLQSIYRGSYGPQPDIRLINLEYCPFGHYLRPRCVHRAYRLFEAWRRGGWLRSSDPAWGRSWSPRRWRVATSDTDGHSRDYRSRELRQTFAVCLTCMQ